MLHGENSMFGINQYKFIPNRAWFGMNLNWFIPNRLFSPCNVTTEINLCSLRHFTLSQYARTEVLKVSIF